MTTSSLLPSSIPVDAAARAQALDPEHSYICVAPAGSGKTELLTQRMLVLLTRVQKPEEILAITFTRKAAAEMQHRVLGALKLAQGPMPQEAHKLQTWQLAKAALAADQQQGWQLLQSPHRLQVRTFDGLCATLVKALPLQAQMGAGIALSDDPNRLFRLAVKHWLAELESDGPVGEALAQVLLHLDNQQHLLIDLGAALLANRAAWLPLVLGEMGDVRHVLEDCLQQVRHSHIARLQALIPHDLAAKLCAMVSFAARNLPEGSESSPLASCTHLNALPEASDDDIAQWLGIRHLLLTGTGDWRKRLTKNEGFPPSTADIKAAEMKKLKGDMEELIGALSQSAQLGEALNEVASLPYQHYPEQQWQILQALAALLPRLVAHLQLVFASEGELDFTEMALRADRALGHEDEPTDLALRLDHRISHVLVDEFQDTSSSQMQLVQKLTAGWQYGDGRSLFCVGDAMQSIYAFRSANVGLFLRCLGQGGEGALGDIPLSVLPLNTNFRSSLGVVEWINHAFASAFPAVVDFNLGAVPFSPAVAFNGDAGRALQVQGFKAEEGASSSGATNTTKANIANKTQLAHAEGQWIAEKIQQLLAENPATTVAILGRGRAQLNRVLPALKAANIRYRAIDLDPLAAVPAVQDVWVLTRALLDTSDVVAWLSVLRAPWCGATLSELTELRGMVGSDVFTQLRRFVLDDQNQRCPHLARVHQVMAASLAERSRKPLLDWVKGTWLALGGAALLSASEQQNVERFFDALASLNEQTLQQQPERLSQLLNELYALPDADASSQIQVMTMHKSKGLEFDAVFLVGLADGKGKGDAPLMRWHEQLLDDPFGDQAQGARDSSTWLLSPMGERGQSKDALYQWLALQQNKREQLEACRLLYVACTRAKQQLFLTARMAADKTGILKAPTNGSLLASIWPTVADVFSVNTQTLPMAEPTSALNSAAIPSHKRLPLNWQNPESNPQAVIENNIDLDTAITIDNKTENKTNNKNEIKNLDEIKKDDAYSIEAVAIGTLVHELLALYTPQLNNPHWQMPTWPLFKNLWQQRLINLGITVEQLPKALQQVQHLMHTTLSDNSPLRRALVNAKTIQPEFPLVVTHQGITQTLRIDLWWQDETGKTFLADYKTSQPSEGQSDEAFVAAQVRQYRGQVEGYKRALGDYLGCDVEGVLVLLVGQGWVGV